MPCSRSSPYPAHLPRPVHAARLLHRPCSCGLAFALRRAACDESLEYSNDLGLYPRVGLGLHTRGYASVRDREIRGRRLRARVRDRAACCKRKCWHIMGPCARVSWSWEVILGGNRPEQHPRWAGDSLFCV